MRDVLTGFVAAVCISGLGAVTGRADDLDALTGKWVAERNDAQGRALKQVLEFKKDKFKFSLTRDGDDRALYAEGDVKTETLGPFKSLTLHHIQGGRSPDALQTVDDDRAVIYTLSGNELTTAVNFDKERQEQPMITKYTKAPAETRTLVIDKIVMHQTPQVADWYLCFEATIGDATKRFNVPDKTYGSGEQTITMELNVPGVRADQTCKFVMKLDDVAGDECTEEMDNKSTGSFTVTDKGSQTFKPEDQWRYTIHWHLK